MSEASEGAETPRLDPCLAADLLLNGARDSVLREIATAANDAAVAAKATNGECTGALAVVLGNLMATDPQPELTLAAFCFMARASSERIRAAQHQPGHA
jgi:hypothetical protein